MPVMAADMAFPGHLGGPRYIVDLGYGKRVEFGTEQDGGALYAAVKDCRDAVTAQPCEEG